MQPNQTNLDKSLYSELNTRFKGQLQPHFQRKSSLITMSHILEDQVLSRELSPVIFTAFQKVQYYRHEEPRYERLGELARAVTVFGQDLPGGEIFQHEWFIVINEPRFKALIASYELNTEDFEKHFPASTTPLSGESNRLFVGFWSYDPAVVDFATQMLADNVSPEIQSVVTEVLAEPFQPVEQFQSVSQVSDLILNHLEKTNLRVLDQIKQNQRLLSEVTRQSEQLNLLTRLDRLDDRQKLHQELLSLYNETARTHTLLSQVTLKQVMVDQAVENARALLPELQDELSQLDSGSEIKRVDELLAQVKALLTLPPAL